MAELRFTILGCGSSGGVPRLGNYWGDCDPSEPRNVRQRCSLLVQRVDGEHETNVLIDTSPDLRAQLLGAGIGRLHGVVYTHSHADHVHGLDDLRMIVFNMRERLSVWADGATTNDLLSRFGYAFVQPEGSAYPPILNLHNLDEDVSIDGPGGAVTMKAFEVEHGNIHALGFRIGDLAYLPDVSEIPESARPALEGLDTWILDALRRDPHPSHFHLEKSLDWIARMAPRRAILTNMHVDLDYRTLDAETPGNITPAYDGMTVRYEL